MTRSESDQNLYFLRRKRKLTLLLLYVDDFLITGDDQQQIDQLKKNLHRGFEMTNLEEANNYLGMEINRHTNGIFINQVGYI